jgi:hypothetical protein
MFVLFIGSQLDARFLALGRRTSSEEVLPGAARRRQEVGRWIGVCLRLDLVTVGLRGRQAPHRLLPTPADKWPYSDHGLKSATPVRAMPFVLRVTSVRL